MKIKFRISHYLSVYILFAVLYTLNFRGNVDFLNLKICLASSIFPALVGGSVINLFLNNKVDLNH